MEAGSHVMGGLGSQALGKSLQIHSTFKGIHGRGAGLSGGVCRCLFHTGRNKELFFSPPLFFFFFKKKQKQQPKKQNPNEPKPKSNPLITNSIILRVSEERIWAMPRSRLSLLGERHGSPAA